MKSLIIVTLLLTVTACSSGPRSLENKGPKVGVVLAELPPLTQAPPAPGPIGTADAATAYHRVEGTLPDESDNRLQRRRLELRDALCDRARGRSSAAAGARLGDAAQRRMTRGYRSLARSVAPSAYSVLKRRR